MTAVVVAALLLLSIEGCSAFVPLPLRPAPKPPTVLESSSTAEKEDQEPLPRIVEPIPMPRQSSTTNTNRGIPPLDFSDNRRWRGEDDPLLDFPTFERQDRLRKNQLQQQECQQLQNEFQQHQIRRRSSVYNNRNATMTPIADNTQRRKRRLQQEVLPDPPAHMNKKNNHNNIDKNQGFEMFVPKPPTPEGDRSDWVINATKCFLEIYNTTSILPDDNHDKATTKGGENKEDKNHKRVLLAPPRPSPSHQLRQKTDAVEEDPILEVKEEEVEEENTTAIPLAFAQYKATSATKSPRDIAATKAPTIIENDDNKAIKGEKEDNKNNERVLLTPPSSHQLLREETDAIVGSPSLEDDVEEEPATVVPLAFAQYKSPEDKAPTTIGKHDNKAIKDETKDQNGERVLLTPPSSHQRLREEAGAIIEGPGLEAKEEDEVEEQTNTAVPLAFAQYKAAAATKSPEASTTIKDILREDTHKDDIVSVSSLQQEEETRTIQDSAIVESESETTAVLPTSPKIPLEITFNKKKKTKDDTPPKPTSTAAASLESKKKETSGDANAKAAAEAAASSTVCPDLILGRGEYFATDHLEQMLHSSADCGEPLVSSRTLVEHVPVFESSSINTASANANLSCGSSSCTIGGWQTHNQNLEGSSSEVFYTLSGFGCLTDADGTRHYFGPGDTVVVPKNWSGRLDVAEDVHRIWFVLDYGDSDDGDAATEEEHADQAENDTDADAAVVHALVIHYHELAANSFSGPLGDGTSIAVTTHSPHASETELFSENNNNDSNNLGSGLALTCVIGSSPAEKVAKWLPPWVSPQRGRTTTNKPVIEVPPRTSADAFCVLEGSAVLTPAGGGEAVEVCAGDTVVVPIGWRGTCKMTEPAKALRVTAVKP